MNSDFPKMKQIKRYSRDLEQMAIPYLFHCGFVTWSHFSKYCICTFWIFDTAQLHSKSRLLSKRKKIKNVRFYVFGILPVFRPICIYRKNCSVIFPQNWLRKKFIFAYTRFGRSCFYWKREQIHCFSNLVKFVRSQSGFVFAF